MTARSAAASMLNLGRFPLLRHVFGGPRRQFLEGYGITKPLRADASVWVLALLLVASGVGAVAAAVSHRASAEVAVALGAAGLTLAGVLVAVLQWRAGLAEKAFDALYQRIALANDMCIKADEAAAAAAAAADEDAKERADKQFNFFVYTEIDSLEYAVRRYAFGLGMNTDIAYRAVLHFADRCERSSEFRDAAPDCAANGGYFDETKEIVEKIASAVRDGTWQRERDKRTKKT